MEEHAASLGRFQQILLLQEVVEVVIA